MKKQAILLTLFLAALQVLSAQSSYDLLFQNAKIIDGSGNPWFYGDLAVRNGLIVAVGSLDGENAARVIDAAGLVITPGFIDLHSHADGPSNAERGVRSSDPKRRAVPNMVSQGVTTVVVNQDGRSPWPISEQRKRLEEAGAGPNVIVMIGHGTVRRQVMGRDFQRPARAEEVKAMRELVRTGMEDGAYGLSAGLEYVPGRWSTTEEVIALVREIVPEGGFYISHQRSEGADPMWYLPSQDPDRPPSLLDAVQETIRIGEETGATVVATHIKAKGQHYWGSAGAAVRLIQEARDRGVQVWADQYPYDTTGSDGSTVLIPGWIFERRNPDYRARLEEALEDPDRSARIRQDIRHEIRRRGGADRIVIFEYPQEAFVGKSLSTVAEEMNLSPVEAAIRLQMQGFPDRRGGARLRGFSLWEPDLDLFARQSWTITASDAGIALPGDGFVHARFYGTFPRKIRRYALERGVITVEHAVRSMTSLPAQILRLRNRGLLREGMIADLTVFDLERIRDKATFFEPHQYAEGIRYVVVGGEFVVEEGQLTWNLPGRVVTPADSAQASQP